MTAAALTGKDIADVTKEDRTLAKPVNFGLLYGMGTAGFQVYAKGNYGLVLTLDEAQMFRDKFFQTYPGLVDWHKKMRIQVMTNKYVDTVFGRRRRLPDAAASDRGLQNAAVREGTNMVVQSVAAYITLMALIELDKILDPDEAFIMSTVHDSIMMEAREDVVEMIAYTAKEVAESVPIENIFGYKWSVPLVADVSWADRWGECK
jgi:DNA polymerase-1